MKIGHVRKVKGKDGKSYLVMELSVPFWGRAKLSISVNERKNGERDPDFHLWHGMNARGQSIYRSARVGALWNAVSDAGVKYKNGHIEHPFAPGGKIRIAVFAAQAKDDEELQYTHEVVWSPPRQRDASGYAPPPEPGYTQVATASNGAPVYEEGGNGSEIPNGSAASVPEIDIDEDEIPF